MLTALQYLLTAALLALLLGRSSPPPPVDAPSVEVRFEGQRAYGLVKHLAEGFPNRVTGTPEDEAAARWMGEQLQALGLQVVEQRFQVLGSLDPLGGGGRFAGVNVLGVSPGELEQAIVIGAHRDIVPETTQGAVDNASGSGTMLELARVLAAGPHRYTYVFASWGAEEIGLGGSRYYVGHPLRPTALALSVDVAGLVERGELLLLDWYSLPLEPALLVERLALDQGLLSHPQERGLLELAGLPLLRAAGTDSSPFALQGIPALGIGWETPHGRIIHTQRDTMEQVDAESLELAGRLGERLVRAAEARGPSFLAGSPLYLRRGDGTIVPEWQVRLAGLVLALFALASPALALAQARKQGLALRPGLRAQAPLLGLCLLLAVAMVALSWLLGLWREPDGPRFLLWVGAIVLALVPLGVAARRAPPQPPALRRLVLSGLVALAFLATAALANLFMAALLLAYPLAALPRLTLRPRWWWRAVDTLLTLPWLPVALALLLLAQAYGSVAPEYAPAARVSLFEALVALLLYAAVGCALAPERDA
ncbi:MAG: M28 family peptidase [Chloroflexi bacterium]|nr:M28 family peptidase [Chloroflexota bacterium]